MESGDRGAAVVVKPRARSARGFAMTAARASRAGGAGWFAGALLEAGAEAPALGAGVHEGGLMGDAGNHCLGQAGVGGALGPFADREVGGGDQAAAFVAFGDDRK